MRIGLDRLLFEVKQHPIRTSADFRFFNPIQSAQVRISAFYGLDWIGSCGLDWIRYFVNTPKCGLECVERTSLTEDNPRRRFFWMSKIEE
ncbi:hypothetical protein CsatB_026882 [Cannabis sativa]